MSIPICGSKIASASSCDKEVSQIQDMVAIALARVLMVAINWSDDVVNDELSTSKVRPKLKFLWKGFVMSVLE
jgi:hypothetical protein